MIAHPMASVAAPEDADTGALRARLDHLFRQQVTEGHDGWAGLQLRRHVEAYRLNREESA